MSSTASLCNVMSLRDVRAACAGGGLRLKGYRPKLRARRVQMMFPIAGSERRGLASLEAKKQHVRGLVMPLPVCDNMHLSPSSHKYNLS